MAAIFSVCSRVVRTSKLIVQMVMAKNIPDLKSSLTGEDKTTVDVIKKVHLWTIENLVHLKSHYTAILIPLSKSLIVEARVYPKGNKESNKEYTFLQVQTKQGNFCSEDLKCKFTITNGDDKQIDTTVYTGPQGRGYFEYILTSLLLPHLAPSNVLKVYVELEIATACVRLMSDHVGVEDPTYNAQDKV